ncbi:MAG: DUF7619 domain-containing protein, partial [Thermodesulfobacteriota bacterium]
DYDMDIEVRIEAGIRAETGEVFANFYSIDPATGLPPPVNIGFLPPENNTGRGQGHVTFIIKPKLGLLSGTEIRNVANIQFDFGTTIATNQIDPHNPGQGTDPKKEALITIDANSPSCTILSLPTISPSQIQVRWSGNDIGSGIAFYSIYVKENDGPFNLWMKTSETSAIFNGSLGHTYHFYCVAEDHVGNRETEIQLAEASTAVAQSNSYPLPFFDDFSTDKGWEGFEAGGWERAPAVVGGGREFGYPDPEKDRSPTLDNYILGYKIGGDYSNNLEEKSIISPPIDCRGHD